MLQRNVNPSALIWWVYNVLNSFATVCFLCCHQHYKGNLILPSTFLMSNLSTYGLFILHKYKGKYWCV